MRHLIFPGKFDLPHPGHKSIFDQIAVSGSSFKLALTEKEHIMTLDEKKFLLKKLGIHPKDIIVVKNPYNPKEQGFSDDDVVEYVISAKDKKRFDHIDEESYLQFADKRKQINTIKDNAYIKVLKSKQFKILGKWLKSSTSLRQLYKTLDYDGQVNYIVDLYGSYDGTVHNILNERLLK